MGIGTIYKIVYSHTIIPYCVLNRTFQNQKWKAEQRVGQLCCLFQQTVALFFLGDYFQLFCCLCTFRISRTEGVAKRKISAQQTMFRNIWFGECCTFPTRTGDIWQLLCMFFSLKLQLVSRGVVTGWFQGHFLDCRQWWFFYRSTKKWLCITLCEKPSSRLTHWPKVIVRCPFREEHLAVCQHFFVHMPLWGRCPFMSHHVMSRHVPPVWAIGGYWCWPGTNGLLKWSTNVQKYMASGPRCPITSRYITSHHIISYPYHIPPISATAEGRDLI